MACLLMAACSSPKYAYHFSEYDYNSGKNKLSNVPQPAEELTVVSETPLKLEDESLTASADKTRIVTRNAGVASRSNDARLEESASKAYADMSKAERKVFRREAKSLIKSYIKAKRAGDEVKAAEAAMAMDKDLKMAAIFGAVGVVALIIGGDVFWVIGGIAMIIGVVFFVLWLSRQ